MEKDKKEQSERLPYGDFIFSPSHCVTMTMLMMITAVAVAASKTLFDVLLCPWKRPWTGP